MIVVLLMIAILLFVVLTLKGVGSTYGNSHREEAKSKLKFMDKNYFL
ncbi:MAG: hypothetical protein KDD29_07155 [Flavobacteriales bacterium]|nr:hypothetical protein [Flavobacteriales bacterium]